MKDNETIARIRAVRRKLSAQFDHDPRKLGKFFMKRQQRSKNKLVNTALTP